MSKEPRKDFIFRKHMSIGEVDAENDTKFYVNALFILATTPFLKIRILHSISSLVEQVQERVLYLNAWRNLKNKSSE